MAFCPNCGTPNTDQAEKCVSCGFELGATKAKPKFKGTIMMQGVQLPGDPKATPPQPEAPAPTPAPAPQPASTGKNMGFAKTMMGGVGVTPGFPPAGSFGSPSATPAQPSSFGAPPPADLGRAATIEGPRPSFDAKPAAFAPSPTESASTQPAAQPPSAVPAASPSGGFAAPPPSGVGGFSNPGAASGGFGAASGGFASAPSTGGFGNAGGFGNTGGFGNSLPPVGAKPNMNKVIAIGCGAALVLTCIVVAVLWSMMKGSGGSSAKDGAALEWRGSLATALVQVSALCTTDCQSASVYFHPDVQAALLSEAKQLNTLRATKLADPGQSQAQMLDETDDASIAEKLQLDAAQCVRVVSGGAKVVGCSVPTPGGQPNLRIVHMAGIGTL